MDEMIYCENCRQFTKAKEGICAKCHRPHQKERIITEDWQDYNNENPNDAKYSDYH